ncbi:YihY/virulence factor BrkB family protein [Kitasatospora sp. MMS16-BH015]|uniref:YihY/virulence factor BrkB family protein n=1 Tax=Kitasatospora sp. MMS16-BH015 TaxID=2018025 RepID=UPI00131A5977|nr:YhjD/YihY/BrkB family envelope integrity protein [Kitasatospora sp. MMS16-BH015]
MPARAFGLIGRIDDYQRRHRPLGLAVAVAHKFLDDQGGYLAALITYYGFLSLFPMLLLLVTALGFALHGNPHLQEEVLHSALRQFPVVGDQVAHDIRTFQGSGLALAVGIAGTLYGALGVAQAVQNAFDTVWAVPRHRRRSAVAARLRGLPLLGLLGAAAGVSSLPAAVSARLHGEPGWVGWTVGAAAVPVSIAVNGALLLAALKLLTDRELRMRLLWPEALGAAVAWQLLLSVGTYYVGHALRGATAYGLFGVVLGLLAWIYLAALTLVACAESGAVRLRRLWPRSLRSLFAEDAPMTGADERAQASYVSAAACTRRAEVTVVFRSVSLDVDPAVPRPSSAPVGEAR